MGLLDLFASAPEKQDRIEFSPEETVERVISYHSIGHGVTGASTYFQKDGEFVLKEASLYGPKITHPSADNLPFMVRDIFEARTKEGVIELLERTNRIENYDLGE